MQLNITGHNLEITVFRGHFITTKFARLQPYFDQTCVVLKVGKVMQIADNPLLISGS